MTSVPFVVLHGGSGVEMTLLGYLYRVVLYLLAFGGVAVVVLWWSGVVEVIRTVSETEGDGEETEE